MAVLYAHMLLDDLIGVGVVYTNYSDRLDRLDESLIDGIWSDRRGDVSAVCGTIDSRDLDIHLTEGIIHIHTRTIGLPDHGDLRGRGNSTAHTVDLLYIRCTHDLHEDLRPLVLILRKILRMKKDCL